MVHTISLYTYLLKTWGECQEYKDRIYQQWERLGPKWQVSSRLTAVVTSECVRLKMLRFKTGVYYFTWD